MNPLLLLAAGAALLATPGTTRPATDAVAEERLDFQTTPPPPGPAQDPADSLYRAARTALNQNDFRRAAQLFHQIPVRFSRSAYAADAPYWEAFSLYRVGGNGNMQNALKLLEEQARSQPRASTRGDAAALATRIRGALAVAGDPTAARQVVSAARAAAVPRPAAPARAPAAPPAPGAPAAARQQQGDCARDGDDTRAAALNALLQMDDAQAVPIIRQVLARRDACSAQLREKAVFLLSQKRTAETENTLLSVARDDPDPGVREKAVFWLSQVSGDRSLDLLQEILRTSPDQNLREKAIFALSQHEGTRGSELLRAYAEQSSAPESLREKAIFWIGQRGSAENAGYLKALYARLASDELKEKVLFSLSQMGGQGNDRFMLEVASNEREPMELRKKAVFDASQMREVSTAEIAALYDRITNQEVREQVIFALSQRANQPAAVDKLIAIARTDRDQELRKKALFWLGQSREPRAAQAILEIINQP